MYLDVLISCQGRLLHCAGVLAWMPLLLGPLILCCCFTYQLPRTCLGRGRNCTKWSLPDPVFSCSWKFSTVTPAPARACAAQLRPGLLLTFLGCPLGSCAGGDSGKGPWLPALHSPGACQLPGQGAAARRVCTDQRAAVRAGLRCGTAAHPLLVHGCGVWPCRQAALHTAG